MATMPEDLRTLILSSTVVSGLVATRCHYNHLPEASAAPRVWFRISADNEELTMDGVGGMHEAFVDVECQGNTETSSQSVGDAVKNKLHGFKGAMGNVTCHGAFVRDKDDDYLPFLNRSDEGVHVVAYTLNVWYST